MTSLSEGGKVVGVPPDLPVERLVICQGKFWIFASFKYSRKEDLKRLATKTKSRFTLLWMWEG